MRLVQSAAQRYRRKMQKTPRTMWQIAYPRQIGTHEHMVGPKRFIENITNHARAEGDLVAHFPWVQVPDSQQAITLNFHTYGYGPLAFHYKETYLENWLQIDTLGYSGWHSSNFFPDIRSRPLMPFLPERRARMPEKIAQYAASKKSKYVQADEAVEIEGNYLFYPLQRPQDETTLFARFTPPQIVDAVLPWCRANNYKLVIKQHPYCTSHVIPEWVKTLSVHPEIIMTTGDVVKIFANAKALLTVSSSVGFEALMRDLPVFCFGASEYGKLTHEVFSLEQLPQQLSSVLLNGETTSTLPRVYDFAAAHLYDTQDPQDIADLYQALKAYALETSSHPGWLPGALPDVVEFREWGNSTDYILHGFSYSDGAGTWTNQSRASLAFQHEGDATLKNMNVLMGGYITDEHPVIYFDMLWNGQRLGQWHSITMDRPFVAMQSMVPVKQGLNTLSFMIVNPIQPGDLSQDFDVRLRGLCLQQIQFLDA